MTIEVLEPHGFCAGVRGAIDVALSLSGKVYCLHELVHNELVVAELEKRGFSFVEDVDEIPDGETVLFSAHGVSPATREAAAKRLKIVDATCPFVARVHRDARAFAEAGLPVVIIGNADHAEVRGIVGETGGKAYIYPDLPEGRRIGIVSQTTMNADEVARIVGELEKKYEVVSTAQVCGATKERQDAVKNFDGDALLVLGSANSSNTRRLCEAAKCRVFRAGSMDEVRAIDFSGIGRLGITGGASTPESFLVEATEFLKQPDNYRKDN
ncbi:MAG: 4-hydroxy-3-methylbut-2-enyl diphosphate reductase [Kiritimatiellae bacterium]|nr:4-hydroxy-3-methylbut-2-enyl diphosphate reductase [Kiritimatiellia bacterium]